jgi:ATP-dependent helicase/nuclease subunit A
MIETSVTRPGDQRERDRIRDDVHVNMCVEAGAGTGKTTVLVDRIVNILASGHSDVQHLAVITFTEKAAAELASRVRQGLEAALVSTTDEQTKKRLERAARDLNQAHIETIHAFASSMLRERPVEAALDPGFEVLDELPAELEFDAAYDEWLTAEMGADDPPDALVDALNLGLKFDLVREAAEHLHRHREMLPLHAYDAVYTDARATVDTMRPLIERLTTLAPAVRNDDDEGYGELLRMQMLHADLVARRDNVTLIRRTLANAPRPKSTAGHQSNWRTPQDCRDMKRTHKDLGQLLEDATDAMKQAAVAALATWLQGFVQHYEARRRAAGKADFDDLLIWARNLLRDDVRVRAYFQDKYRCVLVDEFQDTDPLQVEMIIYLCAEDDGNGDWRHARLRPGSLFVVGDPKQSIYRFRRADIAMYDDVKEHVFEDAPVAIVQNFRSVPGVIDWVNGAFSRLFAEQRGVQPKYIPLAADPTLPATDAITVLRATAPPSSGNRASIDDVRRYEASLLGALIRRQVERGEWLVRDGRTKGARPATFRDITVIVPTRTMLQIYEDELARARVPYRHEGGRTFFQRQEVRELVAVLRAIDDPADGVAAVAALRSAAFGLSDEDLLLHRVNGGRFDFASMKDDATGPVADGMRVLRELAQHRYDMPLPDLVRAVIDRTRLVEFAMLQPQGDQLAANLLKVIDQARTFAEASGAGLRGFVRWLKLNVARVSDETDAVISEETDDVVRILTVHASKGLEFPIVVFANMNTGRVDRTKVIADRDRGHLHVKLGAKKDGFRTPGYDAADVAEAQHTLAEELRLLYVAATRARDRLVLPFVDGAGVPPPDEPKSLNDWLRSVGAHEAAAPFDLALLPAADAELPAWRAPRVGGAAEAEVAGVRADRDGWAAAHESLIARGRRPLDIRTASALKPAWERAAHHDDGARRGSATDFGVAVHALLERCELRSERLAQLAENVAKEYGQTSRVQDMVAVAERALASESVARALRSPRLLLEAPFSAALPQDEAAGGLAEGRIDLLFEEDGGIVIVDFKTDAVTANDVDERAAHYRNQALVYAWAVERATAMPAREVIFLFARPGIERPFAVDDAFRAEAEALMRSPLAEVVE